ncbi:helix-turn-helix domain-containing protein [Kutzneria sp. 744]|uniref:winged helix-turn-helix transcriptional regulator n=1 Tax=Kutzneria sp. (strain 744) TaxID=345341 RepID=UPI0003EEAE28|nr:helix-turn-helix domain-containing protein [Kutzneria sp. 744]EWM14373.1 transcriptional regulator, PadR family [Kutzneria sp. 744]
MDTAWDVYLRACPCRDVLDLVANKWTALVIGRLAVRPHRFGELRREVAGITPKVLTQNLRSLERDGLITRKVYPTTPPSVEYALTPLGASISTHLIALNNWTSANFDEIRQARQAYDAAQEAAPQPV